MKKFIVCFCLVSASVSAQQQPPAVQGICYDAKEAAALRDKLVAMPVAYGFDLYYDFLTREQKAQQIALVQPPGSTTKTVEPNPTNDAHIADEKKAEAKAIAATKAEEAKVAKPKAEQPKK
jgi:hypothetical protein